MEAFLLGIKTYFEKYSYKNTELKDFIQELQAAVTKLGKSKDVDFTAWTDTWLKTPGCNEFELDYTLDAKRKITKMTLKQGIYNKDRTPENRLRMQKFNITALDDKMKPIEGKKNILVTTSDKDANIAVKEFVGMQMPAAFLINHNAHGYGKFVYDDETLKTFQSKLG